MIIDKRIDKDNWDEIKDILPQITEIKSLSLYNMRLIEFPKMSHITIKCNFYCSFNQITSFKDCPIMNGDFYCYKNPISNFKYLPPVGGYFYSGINILDAIYKYSKNRNISLLEAQVELYKQKDKEILEHIDKFPDLVVYIRLKELDKLL